MVVDTFSSRKSANEWAAYSRRKGYITHVTKNASAENKWENWIVTRTRKKRKKKQRKFKWTGTQ